MSPPSEPSHRSPPRSPLKQQQQHQHLTQKGTPLFRDEDIINYIQKKGNPIIQSIIKILEKPINLLLLLDGWHCIGISVIFGLSLSLYNNCVFGNGSKSPLSTKLINIPLFTASIYNIIEFIIANIFIFILERMMAANSFNENDFINNRSPSKEGHHPSFLPLLLPCSIFSSIAIALSNASLKILTLSHYTMVRSSSPIFMVTFSFLFGIESLSLKLASIIITIAFGVLLSVWHPSQNISLNSSEWSFGVFLILAATCIAALRWTMTQILLKSPTTNTRQESPFLSLMSLPCSTKSMKLRHLLFSLSLIRKMSFVVSCCLLFLSLIRENGLHLSSPFLSYNVALFWRAWATVFIGGLQTFILLLLDYHVMREFSIGIMTLSVVGVGKEMALISLSVLIFGDRLSRLNLLGLLISITGIIMYNIYKKKMMEQQPPEGHDTDAIVDADNNNPISPLLITEKEEGNVKGGGGVGDFNDILIE